MFKFIVKVAGCIAIGAPIVQYVLNERKPVDHLKFYRDPKLQLITFASARVPNDDDFDDYQQWERTPECKLTSEQFIKFVKHEYRHPFLHNLTRTMLSRDNLPSYSLKYYICQDLYQNKIQGLEPYKNDNKL